MSSSHSRRIFRSCTLTPQFSAVSANPSQNIGVRSPCGYANANYIYALSSLVAKNYFADGNLRCANILRLYAEIGSCRGRSEIDDEGVVVVDIVAKPLLPQSGIDGGRDTWMPDRIVTVAQFHLHVPLHDS